MDTYETPAQWAKRMQDEAKTGEEAMAYFELMNMWKEREAKRMVNECLLPMEDELIDELIYFAEKYGDIFECDGDKKQVNVTFTRGNK